MRAFNQTPEGGVPFSSHVLITSLAFLPFLRVNTPALPRNSRSREGPAEEKWEASYRGVPTRQGGGGGQGWRIRKGLVQDSSRLQVWLEFQAVLGKASQGGKEATSKIHTKPLPLHRPQPLEPQRVIGDLSRKAACCLPSPEARAEPCGWLLEQGAASSRLGLPAAQTHFVFVVILFVLR